MSCMPPFAHIHHKIFPIFRPNDFFWNTHWSPVANIPDSKSKCALYAKTIHKIMVQNSHLKASALKAEDRFEYIKEYRGVDHVEEEWEKMVLRVKKDLYKNGFDYKHA